MVSMGLGRGHRASLVSGGEETGLGAQLLQHLQFFAAQGRIGVQKGLLRLALAVLVGQRNGLLPVSKSEYINAPPGGAQVSASPGLASACLPGEKPCP